MTFKPLPNGFSIRRSRNAPTINILTEESDPELVKPLSDKTRSTLVGDVVQHGRYATRLRPHKYTTHDGRLVREQLNPDSEQHYPYERATVSSAAIREVVKGLMLKDSTLLTAPADASYVETLFQFLPDELAKWVNTNRDHFMAVMQSLPIAPTLKAISVMKNHDGDIEAQHQDTWRLWQDRQTHKGPTDLEADGIGEKIARNSWVRNADRALRCSLTANQIRERTNGLWEAPTLSLRNVDKKRELTEDDIAAVANTDPERDGSPSA